MRLRLRKAAGGCIAIVRIKRSELRLSRSRQWGACSLRCRCGGTSSWIRLVRTSGSELQGEARRELYVFVQSLDRVAKELAIRRQQVKHLWSLLKQFWALLLTRRELLMKLSAARNQSRKAWRVVVVEVARSQRHVQLLPISQEATASSIARRQVSLVQ